MIRILLILLICGLIVAIGMGYLGFVHPAFDTITNFRVHFLIALTVLISALIVSYNIKFILISLLLATSGFVYVIASQGETQVAQEPDDSNRQTYTLLHLNLYYKNASQGKVVDLIERIDPEIIFFNEMSESWKQRLKGLISSYPYTYYCPEWQQIGGNKIYSRFAMIPDSEYCHPYSAMASTDITIENHIVTLGSVHIRWPWPASGPAQVDKLRPFLNRLGHSALISGDFNSVSWSWLVRRFAQYGNLQLIDGIGPTWLFQLLPISWVKLLGLPIDHVMVKGRVKLIEARTLEAVGSDHLPVLVRFSIKQ